MSRILTLLIRNQDEALTQLSFAYTHQCKAWLLANNYVPIDTDELVWRHLYQEIIGEITSRVDTAEEVGYI